jgi:hypothetical protein
MPSQNTVQFLTYGAAESYACGADALGRRNTARDTDPGQTTCMGCLAHQNR